MHDTSTSTLASRPIFTEDEKHSLDTARMFANPHALAQRVPALFNQHPHPKLSGQYAFTNTYDIVAAINKRCGYRPTSIQGGNMKYSKLLIRMRMPSQQEDGPEIIIIDSHDGTSSLQVALGWITFACMNGLIAGPKLYHKAVRHTAPDLMAQVMLEIDDIHAHVKQLDDRMSKLRETPAKRHHIHALARAAIASRWNDERLEDNEFVFQMVKKLETKHRPEDHEPTLYRVLNTVQENILRGGFRYSTQGQRRMLQDVRSVNRNVQINQALTQCAFELAEAA